MRTERNTESPTQDAALGVMSGKALDAGQAGGDSVIKSSYLQEAWPSTQTQVDLGSIHDFSVKMLANKGQ